MENLSNDTLLRKMDRIGDKLADMEMMNGENAPIDVYDQKERGVIA